MSAVEFVVVLDRSGSMMAVRDDVRGGFDALMAEQKKVPGSCFVSLYQFDDRYEPVYEGLEVGKVLPLKLEPRGTTALWDAIGKTLTTALQRIKGKRKTVFVVATDGHENSSCEFTAANVKALLEQAKDRGWECLFIGANQDAILAGGALGFSAGQSLSTQSTPDATRAVYQVLSRNLAGYRSGATANMTWSDDDRSLAGG